jgi:hypothetical protein
MNIYTFWLSWISTAAITLGIVVAIKMLGYPLGHGYGRQEENDTLDKLIKEAKPEKEVLIVSGGFYEELWNNLNFKKWIEGAKERGAEIKVITGPMNEKSVEGLIKNWVEHGIIKLRKSDKPETFHFIMVDGKKGHIEEEHEYGKGPTSSFYVKGFYRRARKNLYERFNEIWGQAEEINKENLSTLFQ